MKVMHGSQKRTWIAPTSQRSLYSHRKQHMRQRSEREANSDSEAKRGEQTEEEERVKSPKALLIIRAAESSGELMFDEADLVPAKEATV